MLKKMVMEDEALTTRSKVDLSRLPPRGDSFFTYIQGGNHHLACWKCAALPILDPPKVFEDQRWETSKEGYIEPLWSKVPVLPIFLVEILDYGDIDAEVEDMVAAWDGRSDDENDGYEQA